MQADQCGGEQGSGGEQPNPGWNALRIEVMGEQQEEAEHDDDHGVASRSHFHGFQRHEEDEQGDPGVPAKQGVKLPGNSRTSEKNQKR